MKRVILAAVFIVAISGFAAAQTTSAKPAATKQGKATVKKAQKVNTNTVLKQEASANAKADTTIKLILPIPPVPVDSTAMPVVKKDQEF